MFFCAEAGNSPEVWPEGDLPLPGCSPAETHTFLQGDTIFIRRIFAFPEGDSPPGRAPRDPAPRPAGWGCGWGWGAGPVPRSQRGRTSVPLEPISPVRNAPRPRGRPTGGWRRGVSAVSPTRRAGQGSGGPHARPQAAPPPGRQGQCEA